ncbi:MAG: hypothetical protein J1F35_08320 [Erysipelotrichales bacterium]|nr:hypothetical protein [Erysipelotrichales bacterium]
MNWLYFYVIPMIVCLVGIYVYFRISISKEENSIEKRNLYELCKRFGFFLWMSIIPIANISMIFVFILIYVGTLIHDNIISILKKIKI